MRNSELFNIAADIVVNQYIGPHWDLPETAVTSYTFPDLKLLPEQHLEYYFEILLKLHQAIKSADDPSNLFNENNFMDQYIKYIDTHIYKLFPKKQDAQTADAIVELFRKRETLEIFNKKALYIYIREITDTSTPHITKVTKKLDTLRTRLFNEYYAHGYIKI